MKLYKNLYKLSLPNYFFFFFLLIHTILMTLQWCTF